MTHPTVRRAEPADHETVVGVVTRAFEGYIPAIGAPPRPMTADYRAWIADGVVDVAEADGVVVGVAVHWPEGDDQYLEVLAVDTGCQGAGLGVLLVDHIAATARAGGRTGIRLYTNEAMTDSLAWYLRHGFDEVDRVEVQGFRRIELRTSIDPADD